MKTWIFIIFCWAQFGMAQAIVDPKIFVNFHVGVGTTFVTHTQPSPYSIDIAERCLLPGPMGGLGLQFALNQHFRLGVDGFVRMFSAARKRLEAGIVQSHPNSEVRFDTPYGAGYDEHVRFGSQTHAGGMLSLGYHLMVGTQDLIPYCGAGILYNDAQGYRYALRVPQTNYYTSYEILRRNPPVAYLGVGCQWIYNKERNGGLQAEFGWMPERPYYEITSRSPSGNTFAVTQTTHVFQWYVGLSLLMHTDARSFE